MTMSPPPVNMNDIARLAGVSKMTVSKALNYQRGVSVETSERIFHIAKELGYTPHYAARKLAGGKTNIIGIVVPSMNSSFISDVVHGIGVVLEQSGLDLLLFTDHIKHQKDRMFFASRGLVDGLLLVLPLSLERYNQTQVQSALPMVVIEPITKDVEIPVVSSENYLSSRRAIEHLLELGHTRIGMIGGEPSIKSSHIRLQAYKDTLKAAGIAVNQELIRDGDFTQLRGFAATNELLNLKYPPTAIFAANDLAALGAYDAIKNHGLRIPEDISVIGFDDIFQASQVFPALTTVRQPASEMGMAGTRLLLSMIQGLEPPMYHLELPTELIVRASTAVPKDQVT